MIIILVIALGWVFQFFLYSKTIESERLKYVTKYSRYATNDLQALKKSYKGFYISVAIAYAIAILNWQLNLVRAWHLLAVVGLILAFQHYWLQKGLKLSKLRNDLSDQEKSKKENEISRDLFQKHLVVVLIVILISLNWSHQHLRNVSESNLNVINQVAELSDYQWCQSYWDIKVSGFGEWEKVDKVGGWPCIAIRDVRDTKVNISSDKRETCLAYRLVKTESHPIDSDGYPIVNHAYSELKYDEICVTEKVTEDFTNDALLEEIGKKEDMKVQLANLQKSLCSKFISTLTSEARIVYCKN